MLNLKVLLESGLAKIFPASKSVGMVVVGYLIKAVIAAALLGLLGVSGIQCEMCERFLIGLN